jgi:hypothetical protein
VTAASADLRQLAADLDQATGMGIERACAEVIRTAAQGIQSQAMAYAPVKTGALRDSIQVSYDGPFKATIGPTVPYGPYQEFGTASRGEFGGSPYVIKPRNAAALSFIVGGKRVVTQRVVHPGVRAKRYMRRAVEVEFGPIAAQLAQAGALLITKGPNG